MKRVVWTLAMAVVGFWLGWYSQGAFYEPVNVSAITIWAACIGFGFGSIFGKPAISNSLFMFYRVFTLALIGMFFSPFVPAARFSTQVVIASFVGSLAGAIVGFAQLRFAKTRRTTMKK